MRPTEEEVRAQIEAAEDTVTSYERTIERYQAGLLRARKSLRMLQALLEMTKGQGN